MYLAKKIQVEFTKGEKELINNFIALQKDCKNEDLCDYMDCGCCPFDGLCTNNINNADAMVEHINENLE